MKEKSKSRNEESCYRKKLEEYIQLDPIQNVAERNQVVAPDREVARALKFSKTNKASGSGGIPIELLKYGGKNVVSFLTDMFSEIFSGKDMPQERNSAYICPTYKKGDDKVTGNSDRCISVINSVGRVFIRIIKNKMENMMKEKVSEE